jgi:transposase-like protein
VSTKRKWTLFVMSGQKQEGKVADGERRHRRAWSDEEKRRIVAETLDPGASVSIVARRHDINANQAQWERSYNLRHRPKAAPLTLPNSRGSGIPPPAASMLHVHRTRSAAGVHAYRL